MIRDHFDQERKSCAITLSDMEIFVFPEIMYSLVLANIMSPTLWQWREDPWFRRIESMSPYKRIVRLKQFIMDHYVFNLDLETWGLTTQERELARFKDFIDTDVLAESNALFGYHGDKYYFDQDIRKHFGLEKYTDNIIPYWKTETIEAMNAFRHKKNYEKGAGECVSLATLYAAALFVVARIPLADIYLMATSLHSQNFVMVDEGVLTNNRRLVTKNMWINGTELSQKARRALEHERVTMVTHESGCIHMLYPNESLQPQSYKRFTGSLAAFTQSPLTSTILGNFLRYRRDLHKCFQVRWNIHGHEYYIEVEKIYAYETNSPYLFTSQSRKLFMSNIDVDEFHQGKIPYRIILNDLEAYIETHSTNLTSSEDLFELRKKFVSDCMNAHLAIESLINFCIIKPQLPTIADKTYTPYEKTLGLTLEMTREEIKDHLLSIRDKNAMADLAFYAYRDMTKTDGEPFIAAAIQRNPVSLMGTEKWSLEEISAHISALPNESIYPEEGRCAQPDEVWNYGRGDGIEKALLLANILNARKPEAEITIHVSPTTATVKHGTETISFSSTKKLSDAIWDIHAFRSGSREKKKL